MQLSRNSYYIWKRKFHWYNFPEKFQAPAFPKKSPTGHPDLPASKWESSPKSLRFPPKLSKISSSPLLCNFPSVGGGYRVHPGAMCQCNVTWSLLWYNCSQQWRLYVCLLRHSFLWWRETSRVSRPSTLHQWLVSGTPPRCPGQEIGSEQSPINREVPNFTTPPSVFLGTGPLFRSTEDT